MNLLPGFFFLHSISVNFLEDDLHAETYPKVPIKSISGNGKAIGGSVRNGLSPLDVIKYTVACAHWAKEQNPVQRMTFVAGLDALIVPMVQSLVVAVLSGMGCKVIYPGLSTTLTNRIAVHEEQAKGLNKTTHFF